MSTMFSDVAPWPDVRPSANPDIGIGGNKPPLEELIPIEFREELLSERDDFLDKLDQLLGAGDPNSEAYKPGAVHRAKCVDEETLAKCGSLANTLRAARKHVEEVHRKVKQPYLDGGRLVDGQKNVLIARIEAGERIVTGLQTEFAREQRRIEIDRLAKEAEERRKLEELARENNVESALPPAPAPAAPEPVRARADDGALTSIGTEIVVTVTDHAKAFKLVKDDAKVREAIEAAVKRLAKTVKATPQTNWAGVSITEDVKVNNR